MAGKIIGIVITGLTGFVFVVMGYLIWQKEMINLFHDYHIEKVSVENRKAFCKLSGTGVFVIGISLLITAVLLGITDSPYSFLSFAAGFVAGLFMLVTAGMKYNR